MTDKLTKKRRGFIFITFISEDSVDKCTDQTFHQIDVTQVSGGHDLSLVGCSLGLVGV